MRNRIVKEGFFKNCDLGQLSPLARILFIGLWCLADKEGRLWDRPSQIKAEVLPYDDCNVDELLEKLIEFGFISRYEANGQKCIQVVNFQKHQTLTSWEKTTSSDVPAQKNFKRTSAGLQKSVRSTSERSSNDRSSTEQKVTALETPFHGEGFLAALADYEQHRKEKRDPLKPTSRRLLYRKFELWGEEKSTAAMLESIQNGWTGVFIKNGNGHGAPSKSERTQQAVENVIARYEREF